MRLTVIFLAAVIIIAGCVSSEKNSDNMSSVENLVEVKPPDDNQEDSKIYIDSVRTVTHDGQKSLLVQGSFPDGCTKLKSAEHTKGEKSVKITIEAWRNPDSMCTQALVSFSFVYDKIDEELINSLSSVTVNGKTYQI